MTPEIRAAVDELMALSKELQPTVPEGLSPEQLQAFTDEFQTKAAAKQANMNALFEKIRQAPKPRKPKLPRKPNVPPKLKTIQTLGGREFSHPYVVEKMLEVADITDKDVLYDLGSGDGRIVETAADIHRIQAGGVEISPFHVKLARERAIFRGLKSYVDYMEGDAEKVDLARATIVTLFLSPEGNLKLRPRLREQLRNGTRVVSNRYDMGDWKPDLVAQAKDHNQQMHNVYLWRIKK